MQLKRLITRTAQQLARQLSQLALYSSKDPKLNRSGPIFPVIFSPILWFGFFGAELPRFLPDLDKIHPKKSDLKPQVTLPTCLLIDYASHLKNI